MGNVIVKTGTSAQYKALAARDADTLYFLTDAKKIMKGDDDYTASVLIANKLPESGQIQGKLYIVGTTGSVWNGSAWVTVFKQAVIPTIVNDLTTGGADKTLSAEQGKVLEKHITTHAGKLAGADAGHVKSGGDVEVADGLITVKKIDGTDWSEIKKDIDSNIDLKAPKANPTFTGTVTVPTPSADNAAANKSYVDSKIAANDSMRFKGTIGTGGTVTALPTAYRVGDTYRVITAGTYAGAKCEVGDLIIATVTKESGGTNADWTVAQTNIDGAVVGPASATDATVVLFDGATGKRIKGSTITLTQLQSAVTNSHSHANKTALDTYTKTQTDLLAGAKTEAQGLVNTAKTELEKEIGKIPKSYALTSLTDVLLTGDDAPTAGQVLYYDETAKKWKAKTVAQVDISGKLDRVAASHADEIVTAKADGTVQVSGKKVGGTALAATPNANTLATEVAVKTAIEDSQLTWGTL